MRTFRLMLTAAALLPGGALCDPPDDRAGNGRGEPAVFYIRIFGGSMPIPMRYTLMTATPDPLVFFSHLPPNGDRDDRGVIRVGAYRNLPADIRQLSDGQDREQAARHGGLTVVTIRRGSDSPLHVVIHDGKQYLSVYDRDESLWERMLEEFVRTRDDPAGGSARPR